MSAATNYNVEKLISTQEISTRIKQLAQQINKDYRGNTITAVCVLKGSFIFFCDLIRELEIPVTCEFLGVSSYGSEMRSSGEVKITLDINEPLEDKHVLIIEDIVDTGFTLRYLINSLEARNPASLRTCSLLVKPKSIKTDVKVDYMGFEVGDHFVVGYGIDYAEQHRGLPYIGHIRKEH